MKRCPKCKKKKSVDDFWKQRGRPDGRQVYCKVCLGKYNHANKKANPRKVWEQGIRHRYGLTLEDFNRLLQEQGDSCAVCGGPPFGCGWTFHIDHDHVTGKVRGLLCQNCNVALGAVKDNPEHLQKLIAYLETN